MKTISLILGVCIFFSLNSFSQDFKKLAESEVDKSKLKIAQDFATNYMAKLNKGETYQFHDEVIDILKYSLSAESQKMVSQQIKSQFGEFKSLDYAESWVQSNNKSIVVMRFKGDFEKSNKKLEIRVVLNESNKIAGFFIKPWSDMLK
jgi:hypothetical protein